MKITTLAAALALNLASIAAQAAAPSPSGAVNAERHPAETLKLYGMLNRAAFVCGFRNPGLILGDLTKIAAARMPSEAAKIAAVNAGMEQFNHAAQNYGVDDACALVGVTFPEFLKHDMRSVKGTWT